MPGEMGAGVALERGGSVAELEEDGEGLKWGELYTPALSHRRRLSSSSSSSASSFLSFCPSYSFSLLQFCFTAANALYLFSASLRSYSI